MRSMHRDTQAPGLMSSILLKLMGRIPPKYAGTVRWRYQTTQELSPDHGQQPLYWRHERIHGVGIVWVPLPWQKLWRLLQTGSIASVQRVDQQYARAVICPDKSLHWPSCSINRRYRALRWYLPEDMWKLQTTVHWLHERQRTLRIRGNNFQQSSQRHVFVWWRPLPEFS